MKDDEENMNDCNPTKFEKNRYFYGKLMTARDFEAEQMYFDGKRYLINRLLHGSGLVCGFKSAKLITGGDQLEIIFNDGGMALTCCGKEIVVPPGTQKQISDVANKPIKDLAGFPKYLYLRYKFRLEGYIAVALKSSSCEEKCCASRIVDDFDVLASNNPPTHGIECDNGSPMSTWLKDEIDPKACLECEKNQLDMVFLGIVGNDQSIIQEKPEKHRILFTSKELYQLLKCHVKDFDSHVNDFENHVLDLENPHKVKAEQVGALVSINDVKSQKGNIHLIEGTNIKITSHPRNQSIKIDCTSGSDVDPAEAEPKSIGINNVVGTSKRYAREDHEHKLEKYFVDSSRLSVELQEQLNVLSMYLKERALKCSVTTFKRMAEEFKTDKKAHEISLRFKNAIREKLYKRERENDFIVFIKDILGPIKELKEEIKTQTERVSFNDFDNALKELDDNVNDELLNPLKIASQLDEVCFFALELKRNVNNPIFSALNCTAENFRKVSKAFINEEIARTISLNFETAVNNRLYENEDKFIDFMRENLQLLKTLQDKIKDAATEESLNNYALAVKKLERAIGSKDALNIAARQEEVCSSASQLERISENLMLKAMKCNAASFKEVYKRFDSDIANGVSDRFEEGLKNKVYENKSAFIQFMKTNLEIFNLLSEEATSNSINTIGKDLDNFVAAVKDLKVTISLNDTDEIAAKLEKLCSSARELRPANSVYRALKCTAVNFTKIDDIFENTVADEISKKFKNAVDSELYEDEKEFVNFIKTNLELFKIFGKEVFNITTKESFINYRASIEKLEDILKSNDAHKIAAMQEDVCSSAKVLKLHPPA